LQPLQDAAKSGIWFSIDPRQEAFVADSGISIGRFPLLLTSLLCSILFSDAMASSDVRVRMRSGEIFEGRVYDLQNEYLELSRRLGSKTILKRDVLGWSLKETAKPEPAGILLILEEGHEVGGGVRFDPGTREWVADLELGSARYADSKVRRTIQPSGVCSDDRFTLRDDFEERIQRALAGVRAGTGVNREEGLQFLRSAGFFAVRYLKEELTRGDQPVLRRLHLEEQFRMSLPEGITSTRPNFLDHLSKGSSREQVDLLREGLLEHGPDMYPLLGLLLIDDGQSNAVRTFSVDVLQRSHSIHELVLAWEQSNGKAQLALAIALGENGVYVGISTLIETLGLEELAARRIAASKLLEYTGESFGYEAEGEESAREESILRWRGWWEQNRARVESVTLAALDGRIFSEERRKASDLWRQGLKAEADQQLQVAEQFYKQAIEVDPTAMGPFVSLGILQYQKRAQYDEALESFRRAINRSPGPGAEVNARTCYYHIGKIYQFGLDFDKARGALLKAVQLDENYSAAWYELGKIQYDEALLAQSGVEERREKLVIARETFHNGLEALQRYREGLVVLDRTNLPFDSDLPFSTRDHNRTLRELRSRILQELGNFHGRISAISLVLGDPKRVLAQYGEARTEGSLNDELERLLDAAQEILQSEDQDGVPVPSGGAVNPPGDKSN